MSGLFMQPSVAAGPYGVREIGSKIGKPGSYALRDSLVFPDPVLSTVCPYPVPCVLLPTPPGSFFAFASLLSPPAQAAARTR